MTRLNGGKPDTIALFSRKVKKFISTLGRLELTDVEDVDEICSSSPRDLFVRFMEARVNNVRAKND